MKQHDASPAMRRRLGHELCQAVQNGEAAQVLALLEAGASPNVALDGNTSLHMAILYNRRELIPMLVRAGADLEQKEAGGWPPLHLACIQSSIALAEELLVQGASPYSRGGEKGWTAGVAVCWLNPRPQFFPGLIKRFEILPRFNLRQLPERGELGNKNQHGKSLFDHPAFWERLEQVNDVLQSRGEQPLGKKDVLQRSKNGLPQLIYTLRTREHTDSAPILSGIVKALSKQGEQFELSELLQEDGTGTPILDEIVNTGATPALFTPEQWHGHDSREVQKLYHALPDPAQREVKNFHALVAELRAANRQAMRGEAIWH